MIKIAFKNIRFLEKVSKIPILKHFFILKISKNFPNINSEAVLYKFYKDIYVSNKTAKTTSKNRFPDLNILSLKYIIKQNNPVIHDVAVSSGISSNGFFELLKKENINNEFYISDKYVEIFVKKGFITKIFSSEKKFLFGYFGCLFAGDKNIFFPLTVLLFKILKNIKLPNDFDYKILLLHPEVLQKMSSNKIKFINYDIFNTETKENFTFVRAMNILNLGYFDETKIKKALQNLFISLKENGILLVGRTNSKGTNNASFYRKKDNRFSFLKDINEGSEIKHIIELL